MKSWLINSLKQFIPMSLIFGILFLLLRVYEFILLQSRVEEGVNIVLLEFGSLGYDFVFVCLLTSCVLILHIAVSVFLPRTAAIISAIVFGLFLILGFLVVQYFSTTLVPLSAEPFSYSPEAILKTIFSSGDLHWTTVTPLLVMTPLSVALFIELKRRYTVAHIPFATIPVSLIIFLASWFLPYGPSPVGFPSEIEYYLATNKLHYFLTHDEDRPGSGITKSDR